MEAPEVSRMMYSPTTGTAAWLTTTGLRPMSGCAEPGTAPGVCDVSIGSPIAAVLDTGGGPSEPLQALLVGGYHGAWIPAITGWRLFAADLGKYGASPGAGVLIALPRAACGLVATARIIDYLALRSAHQCGPCLNGLPHLAWLINRIAAGERNPELRAQVDQLRRLLPGRGACQHPDGTTRLVGSMLRTFSAEIDLHLHGRCAAAPEAAR
jgi:NADH:ubiquinone oxidoreductase subunit F (NADH-binding)